jgi:hypothetical protein
LEDLFLQLASTLLIFPVALDLQTCDSFQESVDRLSIIGRSHSGELRKSFERRLKAMAKMTRQD